MAFQCLILGTPAPKGALGTESGGGGKQRADDPVGLEGHERGR